MVSVKARIMVAVVTQSCKVPMEHQLNWWKVDSGHIGKEIWLSKKERKASASKAIQQPRAGKARPKGRIGRIARSSLSL